MGGTTNWSNFLNDVQQIVTEENNGLNQDLEQEMVLDNMGARSGENVDKEREMYESDIDEELLNDF